MAAIWQRFRNKKGEESPPTSQTRLLSSQSTDRSRQGTTLSNENHPSQPLFDEAADRVDDDISSDLVEEEEKFPIQEKEDADLSEFS